MLAAHNQFRAKHGSPELVASEDLHTGAQAWADTVADTGFLQYSEAAGECGNSYPSLVCEA